MPTSVIVAAAGAALSAGVGTIITGAAFGAAFMQNFAVSMLLSGLSASLPVEGR